MTPEKNDATLMLRLPSELKAAIQREAFKAGRRITAEINIRLQDSLSSGTSVAVPQVAKALAGEADRELVAAVLRLPADKRAALLTILR